MSNRRLLLLLLVCAPAFAQDTPMPGMPDVPPPPPEVLLEPLGARLVWELGAPLGTEAEPTDIAVQPGVGGAWLVVDASGAVWLSEDQGGRWVRVLGTEGEPQLNALDDGPDEEDLLLEAEALRDGALDEIEPDVELVPGDLSDEPNVTELDVTELDVAVESEVGIPGGSFDDVPAIVAELIELDLGIKVLPVVWVDPANSDRVYVGRRDGAWRSLDGGRSWELLGVTSSDHSQITTFVRASGGTLIAGTVDGVRFSIDDGSTWVDPVDATDGARVDMIAQKAGVYWAATSRGLFRSANALDWSPVVLPDSSAVRAVVPDPAWDAGFWVATAAALLRTDDGGASFYVVGRQPLRGLRDMIRLEKPGHLLAISNDGVWESIDGGVIWTTADSHLTDPDVRAIATASSGLVIATSRGVWRLVAPLVVEGAPRMRLEGLSLTETIYESIERPGLNLDGLSLVRLGVLAGFAPSLEVMFLYGKGAARLASVTAADTVDLHGQDWALTARLCWGSCSTTTVIRDYDGNTGELEADETPSLYVLDGEVYGEEDPIAAAANVDQRVRSYKRHLGVHVADAWVARSRLLAAMSAMPALPLREQVFNELQLQELDARLDALTDGHFGRSLHRSKDF